MRGCFDIQVNLKTSLLLKKWVCFLVFQYWRKSYCPWGCISWWFWHHWISFNDRGNVWQIYHDLLCYLFGNSVHWSILLKHSRKLIFCWGIQVRETQVLTEWYDPSHCKIISSPAIMLNGCMAAFYTTLAITVLYNIAKAGQALATLYKWAFSTYDR